MLLAACQEHHISFGVGCFSQSHAVPSEGNSRMGALEEAVKLNRTLMGVNKHQRCAMDHLRQETATLRGQLVEARAASQQRTGHGMQETQQLRSDIHHLKVQMTALEMENSSTKRELDYCHDNWQKALSNLKTAQSLIHQHQTDSLTHQARLEDLQDQVHRLRQQLDDLTHTHQETTGELQRLRELREQEESAWTAKVSESEERARQVREELQVTQNILTSTRDHMDTLSAAMHATTQELAEAQAKLNTERSAAPTQTDVSLFRTSGAGTQTERSDVISVATQVTSQREETSSQTERAERAAASQTEGVDRRAASSQTFVPSLISQSTHTAHKDFVSEAGVQTEDNRHSEEHVQDDQLSHLTPLSSAKSSPIVTAEADQLSHHLTAASARPACQQNPEDSELHTSDGHERDRASNGSPSTAAKSCGVTKQSVLGDTRPSAVSGPQASRVFQGTSGSHRGSLVSPTPFSIYNAVSVMRSVPGYTRVLCGKAPSHVPDTSGRGAQQGCAGQSEDSVSSSTPGSRFREVLMTSPEHSRNYKLSTTIPARDQQSKVQTPQNQSSAPGSRVETSHLVGEPSHPRQTRKETTRCWQTLKKLGDGDAGLNNGTNEDSIRCVPGSPPDDNQQEEIDVRPELSSASDIIISPTDVASGNVRLPVKDWNQSNSRSSSTASVHSAVETQCQSEVVTSRQSYVTHDAEKSVRNIPFGSSIIRPSLSSFSSPSASARLQASVSSGADIYDKSRHQRSKLALRSPKGPCLTLRSMENTSKLTSSECSSSDNRPAAVSSSGNGGKLTSPATPKVTLSDDGKEADRTAASLLSTPPSAPFSICGKAAATGPRLQPPRLHKTSGQPAKRPETKGRGLVGSSRLQAKYPRLQLSPLKDDAEPKVSLPVARKSILKGNLETETGKEKTVTFAPVHTQTTDAGGPVNGSSTGTDNDSSDDQVLFSDADDDDTGAVSIIPSQCQRILGLLEEQPDGPKLPEPPKGKCQSQT